MAGPSAADNYAGEYEGRLRPGQRPALLIVDVVAAYLEPGSALFMDTAAAALASNARLAAAARAGGVPVVFTNVQYKPDGSDGGVFWRKAPVLRAFVAGSALGAFPPGLTPEEGERVFTKQYPSAFFGTGLAEALHADGIDTLLITGYSTSGCVRATAVDSLSHGYRTIIPEECVADKHESFHYANLTDLLLKYADIVSTQEVHDWLKAQA